MDAGTRRPRRDGLSRRQAITSVGLAAAGLGALGTGLVLRLPQAAGGADPAEGGTPSPTPSPTPDLFAAAQTRIEAYLADLGDRITLAVRDQVSGVELTVGTRPFQTASIVKVDILAALLLRAQQQGQQLTATDRQRARPMIVSSDNAAASALYQRIGRVNGLTAANRTLGLSETTPNVHWGMTKTTAADQVRLLAAITAADGPLAPASRELILDLMGQVDKAQRWGVPAAATPQTTDSYVKNGWVPDDSNGSRWEVNTIGRLVEPGHDWLVAILSDNHVKLSDGITMVEKLAKYALGELRELPAVTIP
ncbi:class A beta-lactamase-related serine hydrolase [Micromonospora sp. NBC_01699]|uniref:serine hydrolase n=1 Tax=Micromonospora sp. NBC_01699 TaxID=2975984 RepID=UPI002E2FB645|nr:serine hydrolase [Micromonospora sp. NBC_01699]